MHCATFVVVVIIIRIGTGWSTFVPQHNPRDVLQYIRAKLDGKRKKPEIRPFVKGFKGKMSIDLGTLIFHFNYFM